LGTRLLWVGLLSVLLTGCTKLHRGVVRFDRLSDCPKQTVETLEAQHNELGPLSDTHTLECTLQFLRGTHHLTLRRSSLGSRLCLHLAERNLDQGKCEKLASEGVRFAETAVALGADGDGAVHYYLAVNLGLAVRDHLTLAVENLARLESELKRAVALSPDVDGGGPLRVLGTLYLKAPPWPTGIGDGDKALAFLKQAVEKHPNHPLNHLFYAEAIWELDGEEASDRVETELATGMKLLMEGRWGYNREPWKREFALLQKQIDEASP
jgi:hypothetical protein